MAVCFIFFLFIYGAIVSAEAWKGVELCPRNGYEDKIHHLFAYSLYGIPKWFHVYIFRFPTDETANEWRDEAKGKIELNWWALAI